MGGEAIWTFVRETAPSQRVSFREWTFQIDLMVSDSHLIDSCNG